DIVRVAGIEQAQPGDLTFVANPRYRSFVGTTRASAVILSHDDASVAPCAVLRSDNPHLSFAEALRLFVQPVAPAKGIDRLSSIAPDVQLGTDVSIGPFVTIGSAAVIGARTIVY